MIKKTLLLIVSLFRACHTYQNYTFDTLWEMQSKVITLKLLKSRPEDYKVLGTNWWVKYQIKYQGKENLIHCEPHVRVVGVTSEHIYVKKFNVHFFNINTTDQKNREVSPLINTVPLNPITAYHMNDNETVLVAAFKNLSVLTFNLTQEKNSSKLIINHFDARLNFSEGDEEIRGIGIVPYTNHILFSPSRFVFYKVDRMSGEILHKERSGLDQIRFVVAPVPSHRPKYDPHNPHKYNDPTLNKRVVRATEQTHFIATGHRKGLNALIDWTTMKVASYWRINDLGDLDVKEDLNRISVRSICFFGGSPRGQLYAMLGKEVISEVYLYSGVNRYMLGSFQLIKKSYEGSVNWINGTYYIQIIQRKPTIQGSIIPHQLICNLGPFGLTKKYCFWVRGFTSILANQYRKVLRFNLEFPRKEMIDHFSDVYENLDSIYYMVYPSKQSIHIQAPRLLWDICKVPSHGDSMYQIFSGRIKICSRVLPGFKLRSRESILKIHPYVFVEKEKCEEGKVLHIGTTLEGTFHQCRDRYELSEQEKELSNDNGCHPGYNLDHFEICRLCRVVNYPDTNFTNFYPSDCLLWIPFVTNMNDRLSYSYFNYSYEKLDTSPIYKGLRGNEYYYQKLFRRNLSEGIIKEGIIQDLVINATTVPDGVLNIIKESKIPQILRNCYGILDSLNQDGKYKLNAMTGLGYFLDLIQNDPTNQSQKQIGMYGGDTPLNTFYCRKNCPLGFYYDFDSISCRKCSYGCAECETYERCSLCIAGFKMIQKPKYNKSHPIETDRIGKCQVGCQNGFYLKGFKGICAECEKSCEKCIDSRFVYKHYLDHEQNKPSFCLKCHQKGELEQRL